jgi:[glutamine synthetase] adenylyltransferase / [glutamine synthetase]-adenylyl-L-tyrosine phosphorylase
VSHVTVSESPRRPSLAWRLARLGFHDGAAAERLLGSPALGLPLPAPGADTEVLAALGDAADPDLALAGLVRLAEAAQDQELLTRLQHSPFFRRRLIAVLGTSAALAGHLARHPEDWHLLAREGGDTQHSAAAVRAHLLEAVGADPAAPQPVAASAGADALDALRLAYRRCLLVLAARDLTGAAEMEEVSAELADLAAATLEGALAVARAGLPAGAEPSRFAVIGMGKCGGRELNYVSDVDVVFVAEPLDGGDEVRALRTSTQLAAALMRACSATTAEGSIWPVDAALRPEGRAGPLVRTLASHRAYYDRWAKTWEFQALLKARPVAGDAELGQRYVDTLSPLVWRAADRPNFVDEVQAMRRRVEGLLRRGEADRQIKLGPGGLRDVEFAVQLLQLVHGRSDDSLRSGTTLAALLALSRGGYVGREDASRLHEAYRFLRSLEHRIQLHRLRRTHVLPEDEADLRRLGRSLNFRSDPVRELTETWRRHALEVRRLHEKLFYRPLLVAVARLPGDEARLSPEAARQRLEALGYADPAGALRHLEALTTGVSRRAAIQRTLLPVMLGWFADAADPDAGVLAFRRVSDALGATPWYLRLLRDEGMAAERMARLLASSRYAADLLLRAPEAVAMLADDAELRPPGREALEAEVLAAVGRAGTPEAAVTAARAIRRRELFRIAAADSLGMLDVETVGQALTDVTAATLAGGLSAATRAVQASRGPLATRLCIVAMGRFGGNEMGYASDADVMFVHDPLPGVEEQAATEAAHAVANELRRLLAVPAPEPPLIIDAGLRPEGRHGPLVRSLASYAAYYARWSHIWESQALLRAQPIVGDAGVGERFLELIDPVRWPKSGLTATQVREIRRLKARIESERLPRGADPATHTKLGRGGLADVEWTVQLLQLELAATVPALRTTETLAALSAAAAEGVFAVADAEILAAAWRMATRVRNGIMLVRGRPGDSMPTAGRELSGVARCLGYPPGATGELLEDYRRVTRHARAVVERVFFS